MNIERLIFLLSCLFSGYVLSDPISNVKGEWEYYEMDYKPSYIFLKINEDMSGVFATTVKGKAPDFDYFTKDDLEIIGDQVYINFYKSGDIYKAKLALAGYGANFDRKILTASLYLYMYDNNEWSIYNTIFYSFIPYADGGFSRDVLSLHEGVKAK